MPLLDGPLRVHLIGAGGAGIGPLARLLSAMGHTVSGSDLVDSVALNKLKEPGIETWVGSQPDRMAGCDLVVVSSAVPGEDPERSAARAAGITEWERPRLLQEITAHIPTLGFTGTHGKTTSTALAVTATRALGWDASYLVGGEIMGSDSTAHLGTDRLLLLEADEAFGTFGHLVLNGLLVTNVDADHLDHYGTRAHLEDAFQEVVEKVSGPVLVGVDDPGGRRLAERTGRPGYGTAPDAEWRISEVESGPDSVSFRLGGRFPPASVTVGRPGLHTARNAAGVLALLSASGFDIRPAAESLKTFQGVRRRLEHRARAGGVTIIDSYAHHPAEISADIEAVNSRRRNRLWVVFQPHLYSRTAALSDEFGEALAEADVVVVTGIYGAREEPLPGVTGEMVAEAVRSRRCGQAHYAEDLTQAADLVGRSVQPDDLVLTLGAGDIATLPDLIVDRLGGC
ncbi:MAG: UDP-N-acetylmuramate--L-alanine ligase [Acidimicrobiia bacterium]|nr:UDP-N-acetylmuramate--L-alanine ligase [Acidimicrobiia bacterium]MYD04588.1 UDP-N-acetylmuramate--L-alanine ligase [Acidimicrobiia bacterium]MYH56050.1 UDP-N-acetylmuramate--L-alanine ligase [Acidimicrobiia bacterium]